MFVRITSNPIVRRPNSFWFFFLIYRRTQYTSSGSHGWLLPGIFFFFARVIHRTIIVLFEICVPGRKVSWGCVNKRHLLWDSGRPTLRGRGRSRARPPGRLIYLNILCVAGVHDPRSREWYTRVRKNECDPVMWSSRMTMLARRKKISGDIRGGGSDFQINSSSWSFSHLGVEFRL